MLNLKYSLKSLYRKKFFFLLIFLQLTFCIYLLYYGFYYQNYISEKVNCVNNIFNKKTVYKLAFESAGPEYLNSVSLKSLESLNNYIENSKNVYKVRYSTDGILMKKFQGYEKVKIPDLPEYEENDIFMAYLLNIEKNFKDNFQFDLKAGRYFTNADFNNNKEYIPAILGSDYDSMLSLNDEIEFKTPYGNRKKIKVIGFLKENSIFFKVGNSLSPNDLCYLNKYVIMPNIEYKFKDNLSEKVNTYQKIINGVLVVNEPSKKDQIIADLIEESRKLGVKIYALSLDDSTSNFANMYKPDMYVGQILAVIILMFTVIGMTVGMLNFITKNIKEFGIHIMTGATVKDISKRIIYEYLIIGGISYIFFIYSIYILKIGSVQTIDTNACKESLLVLIIAIIIAAIMPIIKIHKLNLNEVVKGEE